ncbi:MAG: DUF2279 domain-containing protein [Ignavibacteriae bacterium]|nr:DUF2279 domain-containing protein [Ignavibacteria bacterium]MBI3363564.1 DUF2279 domain-containing protein [Ignavibacteriota bacterium]
MSSFRHFSVLLFAVVLLASEATAGAPYRAASSSLSACMFYSGVNQYDTAGANTFALSQDEVNTARLALVGGVWAASMVTIHIYQQNGWWKDHRAPFHFQEDLTYGLWVDKIGHFYGGYILGFAIDHSLRWANVPPSQAVWIGAAGGLLFQTYVEVEDGFSDWGFDRVDFASDVGGAVWPVVRYYVPYAQNFDLKMSYHPSDLLGEPGGIGFKGQKHLMIDDYEGQTFWMSVKVHNLLPGGVRSFWPEFLCLSLGYGAREVAGVNPHRVLFIAPDLDMTKIIPPKTSFLKFVGEALNFFHLPLPALRIYPDAAAYGVYF